MQNVIFEVSVRVCNSLSVTLECYAFSV